MARRAGRVLVAITCCLTALAAGLGPASAAPTATSLAGPPPNAWIVVDAATGEILQGHNVHVAYHPASTTKIMTALTAVERLPPDAIIPVTALAANQPASKINMQVGQKWPLNDALASLLVVSANDAAYAIAQRTSGTIADFAQAETVTGRQLGLRDSTFSDPAGLDDGNAYQGGPMMSAYDIAISARNALSVPILARYAASPVVQFTGPDGMHHTLTNHNKLVSEHLYPGATGFKTGFTNKAGHTLIATATRNGRSLIAVVLGIYDAYGWAEHFLDAGFATTAAQGTGVDLPPVRVTTYADRDAQLTGFRALAAGSPANPSGTTATTAAPATTVTNAPVATAGASTISSRLTASHTTNQSGGGPFGLSTTTILILLFVLILAILYVLRVRAVRRARARRLARRRATRNMMRRGSLPVVDGRYRTGTRVGKPVESHVQIRGQREPGEASG